MAALLLNSVHSIDLKKYKNKHSQLLKDLLTYIRSLENALLAYCDINNPLHTNAFGAYQDQGREYLDVRAFSNKLKRVRVISPFLPLLMAARIRLANKAHKYLQLVEICEKFAFRVYRFSERRSDTGQAALFRLGHRIFKKKLSVANAMHELKSILLYYSPTEGFEAEFALSDDVNDWYRWAGLKYFLYEYEEFLAGDDEIQLPWDVLEKKDLEQSLEHILPQNPNTMYWKQRFRKDVRKKYTHDVGNLTLTTHNSSYGRKNFPEKKGEPGQEKPCYANSNLYVERQLAEYTEWDEAALLDRRKKIVAWAKKRWKVDGQSPANLDDVISADIIVTADDI